MVDTESPVQPADQRSAEAEITRLRKERGPFVTATETTRMPMAFTNARSAGNPIIFVNDSFLRLTGYSRRQLLGRDFGLLAPRAAWPDIFSAESETDEEFEALFQRRDGSEFVASVYITRVADASGSLTHHFLSLINLTKYKTAEEALRLSEGRFRMAATAAKLGVADIDLLSHEEHWSAELYAMLGVPPETVPGTDAYVALIHPDDRPAARDLHVRSLRGEATDGEQGLYRIIRPSDDATRWISSERHAMRDGEGRIVRVVITNLDVTATMDEHDRVLWMATHDAVTGLPNRTYFRKELEAAIADGSDQSRVVSLLLIDLDHFKHINDLLGHQAGDSALAEFGARIAAGMPANATLARLGGDEFAAILPGAGIDAAEQLAQRLLAGLEASFLVSGRKVDLQASIGISLFPADGKGASRLIHSADLALYAAKRAGGACAHTFVSELRHERQQQLSMLRHARAVLDNGWIEPFYQPKVALATGQVAGFEALLRWRHPRAGLQLPRTIAHAFDDVLTAGLLGSAMAEAVFSDMRRWIDRGVAVGKIAINASAAELRDTGYPERLLARLHRHDIPSTMLELEITETAFLDNRASDVIAALSKLRAAGMTVALDDFGTGFSSLSHIRDFPVDTIKIDRSFIAGIDSSARDRAIVEAVLLLGSAVGMTTVAEGVETQAQADFLTTRGCAQGQGFLFSAAVDAAAVRHQSTMIFPVGEGASSPRRQEA